MIYTSRNQLGRIKMSDTAIQVLRPKLLTLSNVETHTNFVGSHILQYVRLTGPLKEGKTEDDFITETVLRNPGDNPLCRLEAIIVSHNRQSYDIYVIPKKGEDWNKISKRMGFQYNGKFGVFGGDIDSPVFRGDNAFKWLREVMDITKSNEGRHLKVSMRIPGSDTKSPLDLIRKAFPITGARTSELDSVIFDEVIKPATEHTTSTANLQTSDDLLASYAKHQPQFTRGM